MKEFFQKNKIFVIIGLFTILLPSLFYIYNFKNYEISKNSIDWGTFGDYLAGTVGTLIAFFNLLLLIYVASIIQKKEAKQQEELYLFQKKNEGYEELSKNTIIVNQVLFRTHISSNEIVNYNKSNLDEQIEKSIIQIKNDLFEFNKYHTLLLSFQYRYGHYFQKPELFGDQYDNLVKSSESLQKLLETFYFELSSKGTSFDTDWNQIKLHYDDLSKFVLMINNELTLNQNEH